MSTLASPDVETGTAERPYKPLMERLRATAKVLPPSHVPSANEIAQILGALVAYAEFGDAALDLEHPADTQAGHDEISAVLTSNAPEPSYQNTGNPQQDAMAARIADLERALSSQPDTGTVNVPDVRELDTDLEAENLALRTQLAALQGSQLAAQTTATSEPAPPTGDAA